MVAATLKDRNAPTRFSTPDRATATCGGSAPVAIDVAIALPVSWKPLVKSKPSAVATTSASRTLLLVTLGRVTTHVQRKRLRVGTMGIAESIHLV